MGTFTCSGCKPPPADIALDSQSKLAGKYGPPNTPVDLSNDPLVEIETLGFGGKFGVDAGRR
jgi:hypothetical protein